MIVMKLMGTTAVITGSSGRVGVVVALELARAGCDCICHYHQNEKDVSRLIEQITAMGRKAIAVKADLRQAGEIVSIFQPSVSMGPIRVLINSASVFYPKALDDINFADAMNVLDINLVSPIMLSQQFVRSVNEHLPDNAGDGPIAKIINLVDIGGIRPWADYSVYCASKAGLIAVTKSLAKELAPRFCVNAVAPGMITLSDDMDEKAKARQLSFIPAGRLGKAKEVTDAVVFLLENDYITGEILRVDGGRGI